MGTITNTDRKALKTTGLYYLTDGNTNMPSNQNCFLMVNCYMKMYNADHPYVTHIAFNAITGDMYEDVCDYGVWRGWKKLSYNVPDFYKNYNSLAELKAALAAI